MVTPLTKEIAAQLPANEIRLLQDANAKARTGDKVSPKPTVGDIESLWTESRPLFDLYHQAAANHRQIRYMKDELPPKWKKKMQGSRRVRSRLSHNETLRVAAMMTRNAPRVIVRSGSSSKAQKQGRWANALLDYFGRRKSNLADGLYRQHCDALCGDGMGVFEFFLMEDSAYDAVDMNPQTITDPKTGQDRPETPAELLKRTDEELRTAGPPFGLRNVDPLSVYYREDDEGACPVIIVEDKPYAPIYEKWAGSVDGMPRPGTPGWPLVNLSAGGTSDNPFSDTLANAGSSEATSTVQTMRYYDEHWYAYIVGGKFIDGPRRHGLPGVPVFITLGMVTSSPNMHERVQGVTWGMSDMELTVNDLMTIDLDVRFATSRPKPIVVSDARVDRAATMDGDKPRSLDLSSDLVPYLKPGQNIVDAFEHLRPRSSVDMVQQVLGFWQRSGLNPIAQGESPGSDPAGYTVNTLTQAAQSQYEVLLDNYAMTLASIVDFARFTVRDTIGDKVSLAPAADGGNGDPEDAWLDLSPKDVDRARSVVVIDPLSDANKIAKRQSLEQGNKEGYVSRRRVQIEGYGIDDPDQEDDQLAIDAADNDLLAMAVEEAKAQIYGRQQPAGPPPPPETPPPPSGAPPSPTGLVDQHGAPLTSRQGATPAPLQPPAVGGQAAAASQGPARIQPSTALAGQGVGQAQTGGGPR